MKALIWVVCIFVYAVIQTLLTESGIILGGIPTAITQNVKDLLESPEVENIFENCEFIYMLNQAPGDRAILAKKLGISKYQLSYVEKAEQGEGLLVFGSLILPFKDKASLTVDEAAAYTNIGVNRIRELCKVPRNNFTFQVGRKILIKREAFDKYLRDIEAL